MIPIMENLIKLGYAEFYVLGGDGPLCHGSARRLAEIDCNLVFVCLVRLVPCLFFFDVFTGVDEVDKSFRASSLWPREKFSVFIPCGGG